MAKIDYEFQVVMVGDSAVGKSQLLARFLWNKFSVDSRATVGVDYLSKTLNIHDKTVRAKIWDTAGQERFRTLTRAYYREAVGAMLVYDITNRKSFDQVALWLEELRGHADNNIVIMLVGNKTDLASRRQVPPNDAKKFADKENLLFVETSAQQGTNVETAFVNLLKEIYRVVTKKTPVGNEAESVANGKQIVIFGQEPEPTSTSRNCCRTS